MLVICIFLLIVEGIICARLLKKNNRARNLMYEKYARARRQRDKFNDMYLETKEILSWREEEVNDLKQKIEAAYKNEEGCNTIVFPEPI